MGSEFFEQHGFYPTTFVVRPKSLSRSTTKALLAERLAGAIALRGWRQPLHWTVPPAFENPGVIYEAIGHEAFCQQVKEYYEAIRDAKVNRASLTHTKWAIRACLRTFETHVRGFRRQAVSRRGGVFSTASDELVLPETLITSGRLIHDLRGYLRAYGVPEGDWKLAERLVRAKLSQRWGIRT